MAKRRNISFNSYKRRFFNRPWFQNKSNSVKNFYHIALENSLRDRYHESELRLQRLHIHNRQVKDEKRRVQRLEMARKRLARIKAKRKSNNVRRIKNNFSWFARFTPIILIGFFVTIFFGGLTESFVQSKSDRVYYGDSQELYVDIFDYDYTFKLNQLSRLRNIFYIKSDNTIRNELFVYVSLIRQYVDDGSISLKDNYVNASLKDCFFAKEPIYKINIGVDNVNYNTIYDFVNNYYSATSIVQLNWYAVNIIKYDGTNFEVTNKSYYNSYYVITEQNFWDYVQFGVQILFVYPFTILYNLAYDLGVVFQFVFVWG